MERDHVEILDQRQQMALGFVSATNRHGYRPTEHEVEEWLNRPNPLPSRRGRLIRKGRPGAPSPAISAAISSLAPMLATIAEQNRAFTSGIFESLRSSGLLSPDPGEPDEYAPDIPAETFLSSLVRLGWLERDDDAALAITRLGVALLRSAEEEEEEADTATTVVLGAEDSLAYPRLIHRLVEAQDGLLIDPYLRLEQLAQIVAHTDVSRFLVAENLPKADRAALAIFVNTTCQKPVEVRIAKRGVLHDRMIVCETFVDTIGTSINTVGRQHPTILSPLPEPAADALRAYARDWWAAADVLATSVAQPDADTERDSDDGSATSDGVQPEPKDP